MIIQGCQEPLSTPLKEPLITQPESQTSDSSALEVHADMEIIWENCKSELKRRGFDLDLLDLRSGIIQTFPRVSKQWFEFWSNDVVTSPALDESSLHTIRRTVTMQVLPGDDSRHQVRCQVTVQRLSVAPTVVSGAVRTQDVFAGTSTHSPMWNDTRKKDKFKQEWITLGRDPDLEKDLLKAVSRTCGDASVKS